MAKKRKTSRSRKPARARPARRQASRRRSKVDDADPMHIIAALLVLALFGFGIYFYQISHKEAGSMSATPPLAMEKK